MRALLVALVIVVLVAIGAIATGFVKLHGDAGQAPTVAVSGGRMPSADLDVGKIVVGEKKRTVDLPKVETRKETVSVPTLGVEKANGK